MNKKQFDEMVAKKAMLEGKLKSLREHQRRNSLSFLIEDVIEKASAAMVAKDIVDHFTKMAEDTAKIEGDDLLPMMDALKASFGPSMAQNFQNVVSEQLRNAVQSLTQFKDAISSEVGKLEAAANGEQPANDMAADPMNDAVPPAAPDMGGDMGGMGAPGAAPDMGADPDLGALGADGADPLADEPFAGPAGRAKKESAIRRGKKLNESLLDSIKSVLTAHFDDVTADRSPREQLEALKPFITASDYEVASQFPDHLLGSIFDRGDAAVGMPAAPTGMAIAPTGGVSITPGLPTSEPDVATLGDEVHGEIDDLGGADPMLPKPSDLGATHPMDAPAMGELGGMDDGMDDDMDADLHGDLGGDPLDMPFESAKSPARRLRESKNPDAVIYRVFTKVVTEGVRRNAAAKKVAETFGLDLSDVVSIVRESEASAKLEAAKAKPGRDWRRIYTEARAEGLTKSAIVTLIAESSVDKRDTKMIRAWIAESEKQDAIFGKKGDKKDAPKSEEEKAKTGKPWDKKDDCDEDDCDKEKVDERAEGGKKIGLDRHLQRKLNAAKDKDGKVEADKNPYGKASEKKKVDEAEGDVGFQDAIATPMKYPEASNPNFKSNSGKGGKGTDKSEKPMVVGGKINPTKGNPAQAGKMAGAKVEETREHPYNKGSVDDAIASSNRSGRKIGGKEGKAIHALLKGRHGPDGDNGKPKAKKPVEESDTGFPTATNKDKGFPEATNPSFKSNSGKGGKGTDKPGKSLVVGGSEPKGTPKTAGKMAEAVAVKKK